MRDLMKQKSTTTNKYVFELMDALKSPVLTHAQSWADCIPQRILDIIPIARLKSLMLKEELATYPEVSAFIMTRCMEAPMDNEWTEIYLHVSCKVCEDYFNEDHWKELNAKKELSDYENKYHLLPLRRHIYEKRRQILKQRMKDMSISEKEYEGLKNEVQTNPAFANLQLSLF